MAIQPPAAYAFRAAKLSLSARRKILTVAETSEATVRFLVIGWLSSAASRRASSYHLHDKNTKSLLH